MRQSLTRLTKTAERIKGVIVTSDEADNRYLVQVAGGEVQLTPPIRWPRTIRVYCCLSRAVQKRLLRRLFSSTPVGPVPVMCQIVSRDSS
ncbi:hypothetical protein [Bradyrhizobium barranii]|uniref:hypothetical protein n=1 Tax=Bradyrhizobium barranii TaxID=2992140 RepID=UPI003D15F3A4